MEVITYKCPNCGGDLTFDPASGKYKCEYCLSSFTQEEAEKANPKAAEALNGEDDAAGAQETSDAQKESSTEETKGETEQGEAVVYICPNCGAEIVTDATTAATYCFYCHNPVVLSGRLSGEYMPDFVLPFKISKEQAIEKFLSFARKKRFIPKDFFEKNQVQKMTGVYFPYWIYGGDFETDYMARGRKVRSFRSVLSLKIISDSPSGRRQGSTRIPRSVPAQIQAYCARSGSGSAGWRTTGFPAAANPAIARRCSGSIGSPGTIRSFFEVAAARSSTPAKRQNTNASFSFSCSASSMASKAEAAALAENGSGR